MTALVQARPYAQAAFEYALEQNQAQEWQQALSVLALIVSTEQVNNLIKNPQPKAQELALVCIDLAGKTLNKAQQNFIRMLAANHRLLILPDIAKQYEKLVRQHAKTIEAKVISAVGLSSLEQQKLKQALEQKVKHTVEFNCETDATIIGGLIIQIGDTVIDNSISGQLSRLKASLLE